MGLVIVANREPLRRDGENWLPSIGGLTSGLLPVLLERGGHWIAWGEHNADTLPELAFPEVDPRFRVRRLNLDPELVSGYYYGMANQVIWPVSHYLLERVRIEESFFPSYLEANQLFAQAALDTAGSEDLIFVNDYQLTLVPELIRAQRPAAQIAFFWHIPWTAPPALRVIPHADHLVRGMLGADLIGFHTQEFVEQFLAACHELLGLEVGSGQVKVGERSVRVGAFPLGVDVKLYAELGQRPAVKQAAQFMRAEIGADKLLLGMDRLDYTKGIPERLRGYQAFLRQYPEWRGRVSFLQIATPSRSQIPAYQVLRAEVERLSGEINGEFGVGGWVPVRYQLRSLSLEEIVAAYLAADALLVSSLRDGMNLVVQEFIASGSAGLPILSRFAGAATVLPESLLANPFDPADIALQIQQALTMPSAEAGARQENLRRRVAQLDVTRWAESFLSSL